MNVSLMKSGSAASLTSRAWHYCRMAWSALSGKPVFSRLVVASPLLFLGVVQMAAAVDLLADGKDDVRDTFGAGSFVVMCLIIAEIIAGVAMYIKTKNILLLLGLVVVVVFTTLGFTFVK